MTAFPQFQFFLADHRYPVHPADSLWRTPLPSKPAAMPAADRNKIEGSITYGDYFSAVRSFLVQNGFETLCDAGTRHFGQRISGDLIKAVDVFLVKHGQFYHPSRIVTHIENTRLTFVANVAASESGATAIGREYAGLKTLNDDFPYRFVPAVYGRGEGRTTTNRPVKMFLGEWLNDYAEFHLSREPSGQGLRMAVWAEPGHRIFLSQDQTFHLYRMAAMILTAYFNPGTYQHIFPWHHAAGDFVIKLTERKIDVKLITVRGYEPMFQENGSGGLVHHGIETLPDVLLLFFLNMAMRMRLDRMDGVGEMAWSAPVALEAARDGFFQGLDLLTAIHGLPERVNADMREFFASQTISNLYDLSIGILSKYSPGAAAVNVIRAQLKAHATDLEAVLDPD